MKHTPGQDFSTGPVWKRIVGQAIPLTVAQLVQLLGQKHGVGIDDFTEQNFGADA